VAVELVMPAMEMDQDSATLLRWLKAEGDVVRKGEPVMEIETDKVTVEIEAPASGRLADVTAREGESVAVGTVVARILDADELEAPPGRVLASPKARRLAAEAGIDLATLAGQGPIRAKDVAAGDAASSASTPLTGIRKRIADRLTASYREAPHIALRRTVDATRALAEVDRHRAEGSTASLQAVIAGAVATTLRDHPQLNAHLVDGSIRTFAAVNLGVAVALDDGLIVPVVADAHKKAVPAVAAEIASLAERARAGALTPGEVRGGTFTLSNLGMFAVDDFTPILNPPEVAILAIGAVRRQPAAVGDEVHMRPLLTLTLVVDHRAIDGAVAASFLTALTSSLEEGRP
jgi:pyruvate dehydrogenase E2 component (dihydrolipoamide acetyltransferase)